jgi:hypothetical protein
MVKTVFNNVIKIIFVEMHKWYLSIETIEPIESKFGWNVPGILDRIQTTVKPAHAVNSIKQSPVLKGHPFHTHTYL